MRFVLLSALALSACAPEAGQPEVSGETGIASGEIVDASGTGNVPIAVTEAEITGPDEGALEEDARSDAIARGIVTDTIPADFQGAWDYVDGTCARASDLRIEIAANTIQFYESLGKVTEVDRMPDGALLVTLAMSGEGESWVSRRKIEMDSTAMRMIFSDPDGNNADDPTSARKRCPDA